MRFSSMNSVPNYVSDDGVNLSILAPAKVAFIAAIHPNQLIIYTLNARVV